MAINRIPDRQNIGSEKNVPQARKTWLWQTRRAKYTPFTVACKRSYKYVDRLDARCLGKERSLYRQIDWRMAVSQIRPSGGSVSRPQLGLLFIISHDSPTGSAELTHPMSPHIS